MPGREPSGIADVAAPFQRIVVETLIDRAFEAPPGSAPSDWRGRWRIANSRLREEGGGAA